MVMQTKSEICKAKLRRFVERGGTGERGWWEGWDGMERVKEDFDIIL